MVMPYRLVVGDKDVKITGLTAYCAAVGDTRPESAPWALKAEFQDIAGDTVMAAGSTKDFGFRVSHALSPFEYILGGQFLTMDCYWGFKVDADAFSQKITVTAR